MAQSIRPANKQLVDPKTGRLNLEWDAYFARLEQLLATTLTGGVTSFEGRTGVVVAAAGDYTAAEVTNVPAGSIAAVTVQAAIDELDGEKQPLDADLTALAALASTGHVVRTGAATYALRTLTGAAAGISVSNGDGVAGNPTLALANDLAALEALASTGLAARTGADTWAQRTITGTANEISVADGSGASGNPTLSLPATIDLGGKTSLEIPNSAAPTVDADGEIAIDTTVADFSHGVMKYFGGEEMGVVAMPIAEFGSPTDGHVVAYNATNDEFELAAPGGSSGIVAAVDEGAVSAAATLDITLGSADMYEIDLIDFLPATDNVSLFARVSQSGSFLAGAADYEWAYTGFAVRTTDASDSEITMADQWGNAAGEDGRYTIRIFRPSVGSFKKGMIWFGHWTSTAGELLANHGGGVLIANTDAIDGVRFLFSSGNIASGYYAVRSFSFT
jgi:hypothetical protein